MVRVALTPPVSGFFATDCPPARVQVRTFEPQDYGYDRGSMIYIILNALAILAATIAGLAFGAVCHVTVGGSAERPAPLRLLLAAFIAEFWLAAILAGALILAPPQAGAWTMALGSAVVIWIGFVVPTLIVTHGYRRLPPRTALLDCLHWLGVMLVQAAVLTTIGLAPPPA